MTVKNKLNCWEFTNCGMEPDGIFAQIHGPCPVASASMKYDGVNGGRGGGRICWEIMRNNAGSIRHECRFNRMPCRKCKFFMRVMAEESVPAVVETEAAV